MNLLMNHNKFNRFNKIQIIFDLMIDKPSNLRHPKSAEAMAAKTHLSPRGNQVMAATHFKSS